MVWLRSPVSAPRVALLPLSAAPLGLSLRCAVSQLTAKAPSWPGPCQSAWLPTSLRGQVRRGAVIVPCVRLAHERYRVRVVARRDAAMAPGAARFDSRRVGALQVGRSGRPRLAQRLADWGLGRQRRPVRLGRPRARRRGVRRRGVAARSQRRHGVARRLRVERLRCAEPRANRALARLGSAARRRVG